MLGHLGLAQPGADLLLHLGAEALELPHAAGVERLGEIGAGLHLELLVEQLHPLGAEPRDPQQVEQARGELGGELAVEFQRARADDLGDLLGQVLPDPGDLGQVFRARPDQVGEGLGEVPNRAGGVAVGAHPERVGVLDLEEVGDLVEQPGDVGILHGRSGG